MNNPYPSHNKSSKKRIAGQWHKAGEEPALKQTTPSRLYSLEPLASAGIFVGGGEMEFQNYNRCSDTVLNAPPICRYPPPKLLDLAGKFVQK